MQMNESRPAEGHAHFLLVEDDPLVALAYQRHLRAFGAVSAATNVTDAFFLLAEIRFTGIVTDVELPDGTGFDLAREARKLVTDMPILFMSGSVDAERLDRAHELGGAFVLKPNAEKQLALFAARSMERQRRVAGLLRAWSERYNLSAAESVTLKLAVDGLKRDGIATARRVSPNTVKIQVGAMLDKIGASSMAETVATFYAELALSRQ